MNADQEPSSSLSLAPHVVVNDCTCRAYFGAHPRRICRTPPSLPPLHHRITPSGRIVLCACIAHVRSHDDSDKDQP